MYRGFQGYPIHGYITLSLTIRAIESKYQLVRGVN